jgi:hypothetical protein
MGDRSVSIGRDAIGSSIVTGDGNTVVTAGLPAAGSVDMGAELTALRELLTTLRTDDTPKIGRALDDAGDELSKPTPDKDEIGSAIERAVKYARGATDFADQSAKLAPHLSAVCAWLGSNWHKLLAIAGIGVAI